MGYELNTRQRANDAVQGARAQSSQTPETGDLVPAIVLQANGSGYDVATIDATGNRIQLYNRVFPHPASASLQALDEIWLFLPAQGNPVIMVSGGDSACYSSVIGWGVLF